MAEQSTAEERSYQEGYHALLGDMEQLHKESPEVMESFAALNLASTQNGVLSKQTKELMALAIGISLGCQGCIVYHLQQARRAGASRKAIVETISVAVMMGGGPGAVYGAEALRALNDLEGS